MKEVWVEILVEEPSMAVFLTGLLPRILPDGYTLNDNCFIRPHQGKQDLQSRLPSTVRAYRNYPKPVKLVVIQDQDSADCRLLKQRLVELIHFSNPAVPYLVRIACRELENWYLGDLDALQHVYPASKASKYKGKSRFRNPDIPQGSAELKKLDQQFSKMSCARAITSFQQFISGLIRILT